MSIFFLTGMPGVGKSHWGRIWSRAQHYPLYDLDELIVRKTGMDISSIIASQGESGFRTIESLVLQETVAQIGRGDAIVSCGGGTPTIEANLRLMRNSGCVIYLEAAPETILNHLQRSADSRPLLRELTLSGVVALLERRKACYGLAHLKIPIDTAHAGTFAEILQACINRHS